MTTEQLTRMVLPPIVESATQVRAPPCAELGKNNNKKVCLLCFHRPTSDLFGALRALHPIACARRQTQKKKKRTVLYASHMRRDDYTCFTMLWVYPIICMHLTHAEWVCRPDYHLHAHVIMHEVHMIPRNKVILSNGLHMREFLGMSRHFPWHCGIVCDFANCCAWVQYAD